MKLLKRKKVTRRDSFIIGKRYSSRPGEKKRKSTRTLSKQVWKRRLLWIGFFVGVFFYGSVLCYVLFFSQKFQIQERIIMGVNPELESRIQEEIDIYFSQKKRGIIPGGNIFFLDEEKFGELLQEKISTLRVIEVAKKTPHTIQVIAQERITKMVWCSLPEEFTKRRDVLLKENIEEDRTLEKGEDKNVLEENLEKEDVSFTQKEGIERDEFEYINAALASQGSCFYVDDYGYIYGQTNFLEEFKNRDKSVILIGMNGYYPKEGEQVLEEDPLDILLDIPRLFEENLYVKVTNIMRIPSPFAQELAIRTEEGWDVKLRLDVPPEENIDMLRTFFIRVVNEEGSREDLQSVDIRIPEKIFYSTKQENKEGDAPENENGDEKE